MDERTKKDILADLCYIVGYAEGIRARIEKGDAVVGADVAMADRMSDLAVRILLTFNFEVGNLPHNPAENFADADDPDRYEGEDN